MLALALTIQMHTHRTIDQLYACVLIDLNIALDKNRAILSYMLSTPPILPFIYFPISASISF